MLLRLKLRNNLRKTDQHDYMRLHEKYKQYMTPEYLSEPGIVDPEGDKLDVRVKALLLDALDWRKPTDEYPTRSAILKKALKLLKDIE